ncbi:MAG: serine hydrolase domain-containing protein [Pseudomonadota bacterium]
MRDLQFWFTSLLIATFGALLASPLNSYAETEKFSDARVADITQFLSQTKDSLGLPGYAAILFENGESVATLTEGIADASGREVTVDTPFQLASVSKNFSALIILQLAQEGALELDDPVVKHLPDFQLRDGNPIEDITIQQLIRHRSGLPTREGNLYQFTTDRGDDATEKAVQKLRRANLTAPPGTLHQYSNANYAILAHLIETVEGTPFEEVMQTRILGPLGLETCYVQVPTNSDLQPAIGHRQWFGISIEREFIPGRMMMSAGGMVCGAKDLMRYMLALAARDPRLLNEEGYETFLNSNPKDRPQIYSYELGWTIVGSGEDRYLMHTGLNGGFQAIAAFYPESATGFVFMSNVSSFTHGALQTRLRQVIMDETAVPDVVRHTSREILYAAVGLAAALIIGFIWLFLRLFKTRPTRRKTWTGLLIKTALPATLLAALAYAVFFLIPAFNGINLRSMFVFFPDIALCILLVGIFSVLSATALLVNRIRA